MKRAVISAVLGAAFVVGTAGCGSSAPPPAPTALLHPSALHKTAPATFKAEFTTTQGSFVVTVTRSWAPLGADRFYNLVYDHFYDDQPLFRVLPGFVVQWGISGNPAIATAWQNANITDDPVGHHNVKGTITFATGGPNTRTTQVFVNLVSNAAQLDSLGFAPFGTITSGFSVFAHLYSGYGEGPSNDQSLIAQKGADWVRTNYPKLDWVKTARIVH